MKLMQWAALAILAVSVVAVPAPEAAAKERRLTLVAVGDINLNRHRTEVREDGMYLWGKVVPFSKPLEKVRKFLKGDIVFCNLETTVMDRNDIPPADKAYNFKTHPNGVRELQETGFNLLSIANNHIIDYGDKGIEETRKWLAKLRKEKAIWFAGAGKNLEEASEPDIFEVKGVRIAFAAVSISQAANSKRGGVVSVHRPDAALEKLKAAKADIRILSMHAGEERNSTPVAAQIRTAHRAVDKYNVDIVLGHHAHVVQGVEWYKGKLIFFGFGNFSMRGARDMGSVKEFRGERDFGLLAEIQMVYSSKKGLSFEKVAVLPVYDMHSGVHPFKEEEQAQARVEAINRFSGTSYLGKGSQGLQFQFEKGWGVCRLDEDSTCIKAPAEKKKDKKKETRKSSRKHSHRKKSKK